MIEMKKALLNGKYELVLPYYRAQRPEWYEPNGWEGPRIESMVKTVKPGDVVYYVGAEEGDICAILSKYCKAKLIMFEPGDKVMPNIRVIWEANNLDMNDMFYPGFAANETKGDTKLITVKDITGEPIWEHGFKNLCEADGTIPQIKIDDMVAQTGLVPDMITMDTEGADWEVLKGAEDTLRKYHPRLYVSIHPEFMYEIYKVYSHDFREWIKAIGYKETFLDYQHEVHMLYEKADDDNSNS